MKNYISKTLSLLFFVLIADIAGVVVPHENYVFGQDDCSLKGYKVYRIIDMFNRQTIKKEVPSKYPLIAKQAKIEGSVVVKIFINKEGKVIKACIIEGHPLLRQAALKAAQQIEYEAWCSKCNSKQVAEETITYKFSLND
jgi:TonB family protein